MPLRCKDCGRDYFAHLTYGRCKGCDHAWLRFRLEAGDIDAGRFLGLLMGRLAYLTESCKPGCGEMGACHPNLGADMRALARTIVDKEAV